jgi:hypothetical protein
VSVDDLSKVGATLESVLDTDEPVLIEVPNEFRHPGYGSFANWDKQEETRDPQTEDKSKQER